MQTNGLRDVTYKDTEGRLWARRIPTSAPDSEAEFGIPIGPLPLDGLGLPVELEVRLHNEFYARRIFTEEDIRKRRGDAQAALLAAARLDLERILAVTSEKE